MTVNLNITKVQKIHFHYDNTAFFGNAKQSVMYFETVFILKPYI